MVTRNPSEAISTFENLKEFNILADQITFNTIVKGLIVNRYLKLKTNDKIRKFSVLMIFIVRQLKH